MKISFQQQAMVETEKHYAEKAYPHRSGNGHVDRQVTFADRKEELWGSVAGPGREKGKSLIELQQAAENMNVAVQQDYMTVMSHTMSEKDYAKLQEEGFHFESLDPDEAVTIVDKIKAELARAGKHIAGYTDDIDMETLAAAVGSETLAAAVAQSFRQADIPLTEENLNDVAQAWNMAVQLRPLEEGTTGYLIDNEMTAEIWNLYVAQNSGAGNGTAGAPRYYAEDIRGYYAQSARMPEEADLTAQIDKVILQSGREADEENRRAAQWLLDRGYPLTEENLDRLETLSELELPVSEQDFADAAAAAIAEGKNPIHTDLAGESWNLYEKAADVAAYYQSSEILERYAGDITARRQLEEIRLRMTAEVNVKLLKSGFSIDTAPMEELIEALKKAEAEIAGQYFPGDTEAVEKYRSFTRTNAVMEEIPGLPAQVLGTFAEGQATATLEEFHGEGKALQDTYQKAQEEYETLMTAPRSDLGDSIKKAFANVDDILQDLGLEPTEENRRAARILGYNRMAMTVENIEAVRSADEQVKNVVEKMTPAAVLKMIRDGVNPLEKSFAELENYFGELPEDYREASESYSRFLYGLERNHAVTEEERAGYIGVYRLIRQIERSDGAAVGALVNTQAELHFSNLLTAVRSGKVKSLDRKAADELGTVTELIRKGESISEQIARGFAGKARDILTEVSYSEEAQTEYDQTRLEEIRQAAQADKDSVALLQRGEMTASAENLMAAQALVHGTEDIYASAGKKQANASQGTPDAAGTGETGSAGYRTAEAVGEAEGAENAVIRSLELWQKLEDKNAFREAYTEIVERSVSIVEEASLNEADTSLDVRRMQLLHKQLTVVSHLAQQEEYIVPMYVGDTLSRVHLTFDRSGSEKNTVRIGVHLENGENLEASLFLGNGAIYGIFTGKTEEEVMKLQEIADTFREEATQHWTVGSLTIVTADRPAPGMNMVREDSAERTDNTELYRAAKVLLHAVKA
ncbi:MAG: DUF6240 domain-containing protein [Lachnospiraceae bacterium]|nr:DUF6240 domain-containing protein [Lachnospiraceae bacterium]MCM1238404.1 DUF6240 domain-containing protein [Lachnospiraceae bacterium]